MTGRLRQRRALVMIAAAVGGLALITLATALARFTVLGLTRERIALADALADQALQSARDWTEVRGADLALGAVLTLPLDAVLPAPQHGLVELTVVEVSDSGIGFRARLRIERAGRSATRERTWRVSRMTAAP